MKVSVGRYTGKEWQTVFEFEVPETREEVVACLTEGLTKHEACDEAMALVLSIEATDKLLGLLKEVKREGDDIH